MAIQATARLKAVLASTKEQAASRPDDFPDGTDIEEMRSETYGVAEEIRQLLKRKKLKGQVTLKGHDAIQVKLDY